MDATRKQFPRCSNSGKISSMSNPESLGSNLPNQMKQKFGDLRGFAEFCFPDGSVIECVTCDVRRKCTTEEIAEWMSNGYPTCKKCEPCKLGLPTPLEVGRRLPSLARLPCGSLLQLRLLVLSFGLCPSSLPFVCCRFLTHSRKCESIRWRILVSSPDATSSRYSRSNSLSASKSITIACFIVHYFYNRLGVCSYRGKHSFIA